MTVHGAMAGSDLLLIPICDPHTRLATAASSECMCSSGGGHCMSFALPPRPINHSTAAMGTTVPHMAEAATHMGISKPGQLCGVSASPTHQVDQLTS